MAMSKIITLLTDFGDRDVYVGVMKGTIAQIDPELTTIDLTHQIPPQNLLAAKFALLNAYPYFPPDTVHIVVVDPGVGSSRRSIAVKLNNGYVVCPDNGLCSGVLDRAISAVELTNTNYWRVPEPSSTFHGRDIFAPVGAYLAKGVPLTNFGKAIDLASIIQLDLPEVEISRSQITGSIQYIDHFGNLITNIPAKLLLGKSWQVQIDRQAINSGNTYSDVPQGKAVSLIGSHGWVEIALNGGNASTELNLTWRDRIQITVNIQNI